MIIDIVQYSILIEWLLLSYLYRFLAFQQSVLVLVSYFLLVNWLLSLFAVCWSSLLEISQPQTQFVYFATRMLHLTTQYCDSQMSYSIVCILHYGSIRCQIVRCHSQILDSLHRPGSKDSTAWQCLCSLLATDSPSPHSHPAHKCNRTAGLFTTCSVL